MPADGGIRFGQYLLLRRIARGGMAEVFLAQQKGLEGFDRRVAVKRILPHLLDSPDFVKMFLSEAKLAAQLTHPNVVHIYDFGKVEGDYFLAMEYVDGVHAGQVFKLGEKEMLPPTLVARVGADAASALHYAHEMRGANGQPLGLVHRDVSPANIMISYDGVVKLCDFGIAKAAALTDQLTNPGQVKGKYAYMSPEQTVAAPLDGRSDVFSLAIVMWELLTGRFIVQRGDAVEAMRAIRDGKLEPLLRVAPHVPPPLAKAITWALEPKREKRATAAQLTEALEAFIKSSPEIGTSMQLASWIRARFPRDGTGQVPAIPAGTGTAASPGTVAAPGTIAASGTQGPITPPIAVAPSKLAARLMEDRSASFSSDLDGENAATLKQSSPVTPKPPDTLRDSRRGMDDPTLRDRPNDTEIVDNLVTIERAPRRSFQPAPGVAAVMPTAMVPAPGSGPRPRASAMPHTLDSHRASAPPIDAARRRRMRILLAIAGLVGLAMLSFAIALLASGGSHRAQAIDAPAAIKAMDAAAVVVTPPPPPADATEAVAPPAGDAAVAMGYLEVQTEPPGGTVKVGDQTRTAPAQLIIPAGHVEITGELAGWADVHREVDLEAGEHHEVEIVFTKKIEHRPEIGKLTVRTTPYSDVYENGNLIATTPFAERPMSPGPHTLVFKNPKHATIEKKITIVAGRTLKLNFNLP